MSMKKLSAEEKLARKLFRVGYAETIRRGATFVVKPLWDSMANTHRAGWLAVARYVLQNYKQIKPFRPTPNDPKLSDRRGEASHAD
jgi:hypothetical protein